MEEKESAHSFKRNAEKSKIEPVKWKLSKSQTRGSKNGVEWGANGGWKVKEKKPEQCQGERAPSREEEKWRKKGAFQIK